MDTDLSTLAHKPNAVIAALTQRGVSCGNRALIENWCEARAVCTDEQLLRKLISVAVRGCERPQHLKDLPLLGALGLDLFGSVSWPTQRVSNTFTGAVTSLEGGSVLAGVFRSAPVEWIRREMPTTLGVLRQVPVGPTRIHRGHAEALSTLEALVFFDDPERLDCFLACADVTTPTMQSAIVGTLARLTSELADGLMELDHDELNGMSARSQMVCSLIEACDGLASLEAMLGPPPGQAQWHSPVLVLAADANKNLSPAEQRRMILAAEKLVTATSLGVNTLDRSGKTPVQVAWSRQQPDLAAAIMKALSLKARGAFHDVVADVRRGPR